MAELNTGTGAIPMAMGSATQEEQDDSDDYVDTALAQPVGPISSSTPSAPSSRPGDPRLPVQILEFTPESISPHEIWRDEWFGDPAKIQHFLKHIREHSARYPTLRKFEDFSAYCPPALPAVKSTRRAFQRLGYLEVGDETAAGFVAALRKYSRYDADADTPLQDVLARAMQHAVTCGPQSGQTYRSNTCMGSIMAVIVRVEDDPLTKAQWEREEASKDDFFAPKPLHQALYTDLRRRLPSSIQVPLDKFIQTDCERVPPTQLGPLVLVQFFQKHEAALNLLMASHRPVPARQAHCTHCKRDGHTLAECRKAKTEAKSTSGHQPPAPGSTGTPASRPGTGPSTGKPNPSPQSSSGQSSSSPGLKCYRCQQQGHLRKDCPLKATGTAGTPRRVAAIAASSEGTESA